MLKFESGFTFESAVFRSPHLLQNLWICSRAVNHVFQRKTQLEPRIRDRVLQLLHRANFRPRFAKFSTQIKVGMNRIHKLVTYFSVGGVELRPRSLKSELDEFRVLYLTQMYWDTSMVGFENKINLETVSKCEIEESVFLDRATRVSSKKIQPFSETRFKHRLGWILQTVEKMHQGA